MLTDREKFLMREAMNAATYYEGLDQWLNEIISDAGHTVEQHLSHDADMFAYKKSQEGAFHQNEI